MIKLKRVYEEPSLKDGVRILVDRLWPRGLTKERAAVRTWLKEIAPSTQLRQWFGHDPARWPQFKARYRKELAQKKDLLKTLKRESQAHTVTLVYAARDQEHNEAIVLKEILDGRTRIKEGKSHEESENRTLTPPPRPAVRRRPARV